jgi:hypothetical protein
MCIPALVESKLFPLFFFLFLLANAMGRIGGITSPFIISESTSLRTIGIVMFVVSSATAIFTRCLPETSGRALGDFDGSCVVVMEQKSTSKLGVMKYPRAPLKKAEPSNFNIVSSEDEDDDIHDMDLEDKDASSFELL